MTSPVYVGVSDPTAPLVKLQMTTVADVAASSLATVEGDGDGVELEL